MGSNDSYFKKNIITVVYGLLIRCNWLVVFINILQIVRSFLDDPGVPDTGSKLTDKPVDNISVCISIASKVLNVTCSRITQLLC